MLTKLMAQHGGVEPVEGQLAPIDHFDQAFQYFGFLTDLVAKAELLIALDEAQRLHRLGAGCACLLLLHRSILLRAPRSAGRAFTAPFVSNDWRHCSFHR